MPDLKVAMHMVRVSEPLSPALVLHVRNFIISLEFSLTRCAVGCRYGVGDSVGLAVQLENRYRGVRSPHKFKGGVSGCVRECAEAQGKDFGLIATDKGWNSVFFSSLYPSLLNAFVVFVGGNGGANPVRRFFSCLVLSRLVTH